MLTTPPMIMMVVVTHVDAARSATAQTISLTDISSTAAVRPSSLFSSDSSHSTLVAASSAAFCTCACDEWSGVSAS